MVHWARNAATGHVDQCLASRDLGPVNKSFVRDDYMYTVGTEESDLMQLVQRRLDLKGRGVAK